MGLIQSSPFRIICGLAVAAFFCGIKPAVAQQVSAAFEEFYSAVDLGSIPGVDIRYGGVNFAIGNFNKLLIGGRANGIDGVRYAVDLVRDSNGHITGFSGSATEVASAPYNDGGLAYGPGNVLFMSEWPVSQIAQYKPGSTSPDKTIDLTGFGIYPGGATSNAALNFVPAGFAGSGKLKLVSWNAGYWYDAQYSPDGQGTYNITSVTEVPASRVMTGPEGFFYVPPLSPGFSGPSMVIAEYSGGSVSAYQVDANGDPIIASRQEMLFGLTGAEGGVIDPVSGDMVFSTFGGVNHIEVLRGFVPALRGDFNQDSHVNAADIKEMMLALTNPDAYQLKYGLTNADIVALGDFNRDGIANNADLQSLLTILKSGGGTTDPVPEPSTFFLSAFGLLACLWQINRCRLPRLGLA